MSGRVEAGRGTTEVEARADGRGRNVVFAAPADDPRARRPIDAVVAVASWVVVFLLAWNFRVGSDLDRRVLSFFEDGVPGWISGIASVVFVFGGIYGFGLLVGIGFFGHGRIAIARDMLLAGILAFAGLVALAYVGGPEFPDFFPEWLEENGTPSFPVVRLAMMVAVIGVAGPYLSVPMRKVGRRTLVAMTLATVILSYGTVNGVIGGVLLGVAASSTIHFLLGSGTGIPSRARIESGLRDAGIAVESIEFLPVQPAGATLVRAVRSDADDVLVKVYGRDAADAALASRLWRATWFRNDTRPLFATNAQLAEHESLMLLACERIGVPMVELVGWSRAATDDMLVVTTWVDGRRLSQLDATEIDDSMLDRMWAGLGVLHAGGITHGGIDRDAIVVTPDRIVLADMSQANILSSPDQLCADHAQLIVTTTLAVGEDRAVAAARRGLSDDEILATLAFLQAPALPRELQRDAHGAKLKIDKLRERVTEELGVAAPEMAQLQRITWGHVAMIALTLFAANALISSLTDIGFDTIVDEMSGAVWGWVAIGFVLAQLTNVGEYLTLVGVVGRPVPFGPTIMFRYAISFISLAVPSDAGAIAMNIRYQQRLGVPPAAAVAQGPLLTIISKGFDVILLLIAAQFVSNSIDFDTIDTATVGKLLAVVLVAVVAAVAVVALVPKLRAKMVPHLREGFAAVKDSVTDPERLTKIVGGTLLQKILFALTLSASVAAFGPSLGFAEAIFVNTIVSLFIGLVPVPGGIGVAETALTAALVAVGIPQEAAIAAAITHRMLTAYIPPIYGWFASRWLTEHNYL